MARRLRPGENPARPLVQRMRGLAAILESDPRAPPTWEAALVLLGSIQGELSQPGSGITRKSRGITSHLAGLGTKRRAKQLHQASAPGEPPAPDISELRRSFGLEVRAPFLRVGTPLPQAPALDRGAVIARTALRKDGTVTNYVIVIAPRPFMEPAYLKARPDMRIAAAVALEAMGERILVLGGD